MAVVKLTRHQIELLLVAAGWAENDDFGKYDSTNRAYERIIEKLADAGGFDAAEYKGWE